jgi:hypothetical protein
MTADFRIKPLVKGDTRSLLEADTANEVIQAVNKLITIEVRWVSAGSSRLEVSGQNAVLILSTADMPS